jgi:triosephosphate isomerase (TIM)
MVSKIFINFKTYEEATGKKAIELAKKAERIAEHAECQIILVVQAVDLRAVSEAVSLPVFAQHIDPINYGSNTGHVLPEAVKEAGATGTVLNHAENKQTNDFLEKAVKRAKSVGLQVMVCAETIERAKQIAVFSPDLIAIEPPELIGGDISVSTAKPEIISGTVQAVHEVNQIPVVTGAGIKNSADVKKAIELGTTGVFVASGIIKAEDQEKAIQELAEGFL